MCFQEMSGLSGLTTTICWVLGSDERHHCRSLVYSQSWITAGASHLPPPRLSYISRSLARTTVSVHVHHRSLLVSALPAHENTDVV